MKLIKITTRKHYETYAELSKNVPIGLAPLSHESSLEELTSLYNQDNNLNNIPLSRFDIQFDYVHKCVRKPLSLSQSCCILKHILIYKVLKAEPVFES